MYIIWKPPWTYSQHDEIIVLIDKLSKVAHFLVIKLVDKESDIGDIFVKEIMWFHGVPNNIILDNMLISTLIFSGSLL